VRPTALGVVLCDILYTSYPRDAFLVSETLISRPCSCYLIMVFKEFFRAGWTPVSRTTWSKGDELAKESFLYSEEQNSLPYHQPITRKYTIISHAATFFTAVLLSTAVVVVYQQPLFNTTSGPTTKRLHCGNTTAEARENGCVYDFLSNMVSFLISKIILYGSY